MTLRDRFLTIPWVRKSVANTLYNPALRYWLRLSNGYPVRFDYQYDLAPRYGHGRPPHAKLQELFDRTDYRPLIESFAPFAENLLRLPKDPKPGIEPAWDNGWLPPLDGIALYGLLAARKPATFLEVGSGNSTKFAARARRDLGLTTRLVSIDPHPRAEIDSLCDEVVRQPFEETDLSRFAALQPGDVVFIDNSHRSLMGSDATVFFLDVLPNLPGGVIAGIHDIFLPHDYPPDWKYRYYNEQYLLASFLLAARAGFKVLLPSHHVSLAHPEALQPLQRLWDAGIDRYGSAFWIEIER